MAKDNHLVEASSTSTTGSARRARPRLLYWIPTGLVALMMGAGGVGDALRAESALAVMRHLGYPDYFTALLGVAKVLGVFALLAPVPRTLREWAYAGFTFDLIAAAISIVAAGDPIVGALAPLLFLVPLHLSYWAWRRRSVAADSEAASLDLGAHGAPTLVS